MKYDYKVNPKRLGKMQPIGIIAKAYNPAEDREGWYDIVHLTERSFVEWIKNADEDQNRLLEIVKHITEYELEYL